MLHAKFIAIAALALTLGANNTFAATSRLAATNTFDGPAHEISGQLKTAVRKDFNKAELIDYTSSKDYTCLTLKVNDMIVFAYYSEKGDLLATTRNIKSTQLPLPLLLELKKNYSNYWITDLFEMSSDGQTNYYMTMESADTRLNLKSFDNDSWETVH